MGWAYHIYGDHGNINIDQGNYSGFDTDVGDYIYYEWDTKITVPLGPLSVVTFDGFGEDDAISLPIGGNLIIYLNHHTIDTPATIGLFVGEASGAAPPVFGDIVVLTPDGGVGSTSYFSAYIPPEYDCDVNPGYCAGLDYGNSSVGDNIYGIGVVEYYLSEYWVELDLGFISLIDDGDGHVVAVVDQLSVGTSPVSLTMAESYAGDPPVTWTMSSNPVPLPPALWLLLSGSVAVFGPCLTKSICLVLADDRLQSTHNKSFKFAPSGTDAVNRAA